MMLMRRHAKTISGAKTHLAETASGLSLPLYNYNICTGQLQIITVKQQD